MSWARQAESSSASSLTWPICEDQVLMGWFSALSRGAKLGRMSYSSAGIGCAVTPRPLLMNLCRLTKRWNQPATPPVGVTWLRTRASTAPQALSMCSHVPPLSLAQRPGGKSSQNAARYSCGGGVLAKTLAAPLNRAGGMAEPREAASTRASARDCSSLLTPAALALLARTLWVFAAGALPPGGAGGDQVEEYRVGAFCGEGFGDPLLEDAHLFGGQGAVAGHEEGLYDVVSRVDGQSVVGLGLAGAGGPPTGSCCRRPGPVPAPRCPRTRGGVAGAAPRPGSP